MNHSLALTPLALLLALHAPLLETERRALVENIATEMRRSYVDPAIGEKAAALLQQKLRSGDYESITGPEQLAAALHQDLSRITEDKHLMLMYSETALPVDYGRNEDITDPPADPEAARYENAGISRIERLAGNVGYIKLDLFYPPKLAADALAAAMALVANTDALIIDLRSNIGGHPETVAFLCTYFFADRQHLNDLYNRETRERHQFWTLPHVPGRRYAQPVYLLTSESTFSAAEEFAYNLKVLKRATLVGETTGGAANPAVPRRIAEHFVLYLSVGRAINPVTNSNWERTGVQPDVAVSAADSLKRAHRLALESLIAAASRLPNATARRSLLEQEKQKLVQP